MNKFLNINKIFYTLNLNRENRVNMEIAVWMAVLGSGLVYTCVSNPFTM